MSSKQWLRILLMMVCVRALDFNWNFSGVWSVFASNGTLLLEEPGWQHWSLACDGQLSVHGKSKQITLELIGAINSLDGHFNQYKLAMAATGYSLRNEYALMGSSLLRVETCSEHFFMQSVLTASAAEFQSLLVSEQLVQPIAFLGENQ